MAESKLVRVIAGTAKGHKLKSLEGRSARPTADRVKESLFNILMPVTAGAIFLDLFAGTGSVGIEALSRGARAATFVDENQCCIEIIKDNLAHTKLAGNADVIRGNAFDAIQMMASKGCKYDIIFIDPPYGVGIPDRILGDISRLGILNENGIIIVEKSRKDNIGRQFGNIILKDVRRYGDTELVFYGFKAERGTPV